jgi:IMP dehydrogenase
MNIPLVSAVMQSVSATVLRAWPRRAGVCLIYWFPKHRQRSSHGGQSEEPQSGLCHIVIPHPPDHTLAGPFGFKDRTGHSTTAVTDDGTAQGKVVGIVTTGLTGEPDALDTKVSEFMTPSGQADPPPVKGVTLSEANDILWDHKLNALPILDDAGRQILRIRKGLTILTKPIPWSCWTAISATV